MNMAQDSENHSSAAILAQALTFHQYNHLHQASSLYRKILEDEPAHPEALHMLGVALIQQGDQGAGVELIRDALEQNPTPAMWLNLGSGLAQLRRHEEAIAALNQALELVPDNPEALNNLGVAFAATSRHEEALRQFGRALQIRPDFAACHSNRSNSLRALHRVNDAIRAAEQALRLQPDNPDSLNCLGMALAAALREQESLECFNKALRLAPGHIETLANRARLLRRTQHPEEAVADYLALVATHPENIHAHNDLGLTLHQIGRHTEALPQFDAALALAPNVADLHNNRGNTLAALGRAAEALASFERAIELDPRHVEALNNLANTLLTLGQAGKALPLAERVCALAPGFPQAHNNRGLALAAAHRHAEALDAFDQALVLRADYAEALNNRGQTLETLGQTGAALRDYARALVCQPEHQLARWNKAQAHLRRGEFSAAWPLFEARRHLSGPVPQQRLFGTPHWQGESLRGRSILLWAEGNLGETLLFCRFASRIADLGAKVYLELPEELQPLARGIRGVQEILGSGQPLPSTDFHCPLPELPALLSTGITSIPAELPYLTAPQPQLAEWLARLPSKPRRIAIVCAGTAALPGFPAPETGLAEFSAILDSGCAPCHLLPDEAPLRTGELATTVGPNDLRGSIRTLADLAAALSCMDLVIGADSVATRLAGALNRPVWLLLPERADWCWLLGRTDSPWFPAARLFRQQAGGDWGRVMAQLIPALHERYPFPLLRPGQDS